MAKPKAYRDIAIKHHQEGKSATDIAKSCFLNLRTVQRFLIFPDHPVYNEKNIFFEICYFEIYFY